MRRLLIHSNNNNNKLFISSKWTYTYIHTYFNSLRYNREVHRQLEMLFIHLNTLSRKINQASTANVDNSTILDQRLKMKQSIWVISGRPRFIPLYIIDSRNCSTYWIIKIFNNLIVNLRKVSQYIF